MVVCMVEYIWLDVWLDVYLYVRLYGCIHMRSTKKQPTIPTKTICKPYIKKNKKTNYSSTKRCLRTIHAINHIQPNHPHTMLFIQTAFIQPIYPFTVYTYTHNSQQGQETNEGPSPFYFEYDTPESIAIARSLPEQVFELTEQEEQVYNFIQSTEKIGKATKKRN